MGKINLLEQNVFNMISAGEVVERPASVVKELVENSIDAGADEISIHIEQGGTRLIQVSDNGVGIMKEDMRKAFLPHATSKLSKITDLDRLATLGFRGEALASISSVSEVTLISSCAGECSKLCLSGGNVTFEGQDSRAQGTIISVENLFFNTPARLKFLKKASSEQSYIKDMVKILIFANPHISISLTSEDGDLLSNQSGNLIDAIYSIYGAKTADNLLEVKPRDYDTIRVNGYISKVDFVKPNRTYQHIIVNGRGVEDVTIQTAVERAYSEFLMKRTYPMFVIDVVMPFEDVDVNVHPSKTEIRFRDKNAVFSAVYHAVLDTINASISNISYGFDIESVQNASDDMQNLSANSASIMQNLPKDSIDYSTRKVDDYVQARIDTSKLFSGATIPSEFVGKSYDIESSKQSTLNDSPIGAFMSVDFDVKAREHQVFDYKFSASEEQSSIFDGKIIGQIFDTYILCERGDLVYLIDQHAAHERILYDRILDKFSVEYKQPLLLPFKMSMTGEEEEYFVRVMPTLINLGFDVDKSNGAYMINAVPEPIAKLNFSKFFSELFGNMLDENELTLEGLLKDKLCQQACKAAIKGGESLTRAQIERVIGYYVDENGNLPSKCPHGRPAVLAFSKTDIEKLFKRIV